jgi:hypothetical protein
MKGRPGVDIMKDGARRWRGLSCEEKRKYMEAACRAQQCCRREGERHRVTAARMCELLLELEQPFCVTFSEDGIQISYIWIRVGNWSHCFICLIKWHEIKYISCQFDKSYQHSEQVAKIRNVSCRYYACIGRC